MHKVAVDKLLQRMKVGGEWVAAPLPPVLLVRLWHV